MNPKTFEGRTMDEIIQAATDHFQHDAEFLEFNILQEKKGLFGLGSRFVCEVSLQLDPLNAGLDYLNQLLMDLDLSGSVDFSETDESITYSIDSSNNGFLIGKNGKGLQSLQTLTSQVVARNGGQQLKVIVDVDNYRQKQIGRLEDLAKRVAKEVIQTKIDATLDPMNAFERRVIHQALSGWNQIKTVSAGEEPNRHLIIKYK